MRRNLLYTGIICCAFLGFVGWRVHVSQVRPVPDFVVIEDPSSSHATGCESLLGLTQRAMRGTVRKGSNLTILVLGDAATSNEPRELGLYPIPTSDRVMEGLRAIREREEQVLDDVQNKCQSIRHTTVSPIFLGVEQGVADLRAQGCKRYSGCILFMDTDLQENQDRLFLKMLRGDRGVAFAQPIDNTGIGIEICGVAVTAGPATDRTNGVILSAQPRSPERDEELRRAWLSVFTEPQTITFEPYCPGVSADK
jgi:hypothetical protein